MKGVGSRTLEQLNPEFNDTQPDRYRTIPVSLFGLLLLGREPLVQPRVQTRHGGVWYWWVGSTFAFRVHCLISLRNYTLRGTGFLVFSSLPVSVFNSLPGLLMHLPQPHKSTKTKSCERIVWVVLVGSTIKGLPRGVPRLAQAIQIVASGERGG